MVMVIYCHSNDSPDNDTLVFILYQHVAIHIVSECPYMGGILIGGLWNNAQSHRTHHTPLTYHTHTSHSQHTGRSLSPCQWSRAFAWKGWLRWAQGRCMSGGYSQEITTSQCYTDLLSVHVDHHLLDMCTNYYTVLYSWLEMNHMR